MTVSEIEETAEEAYAAYQAGRPAAEPVRSNVVDGLQHSSQRRSSIGILLRQATNIDNFAKSAQLSASIEMTADSFVFNRAQVVTIERGLPRHCRYQVGATMSSEENISVFTGDIDRRSKCITGSDFLDQSQILIGRDGNIDRCAGEFRFNGSQIAIRGLADAIQDFID